MEKSTGGVSLDIRFIDSSNSSENYSSVESRRLIGIYDGDWSLEEDGTVNASMAFARRVGDIRSHGNLIEKVRGIGESMARVSISECLAVEDEVKVSGWLLADPMSHSGISFLRKVIPTELVVPDSIENNPDDDQKLEIVRLALRVGAVALHCVGLSLEELKESPTESFSPDKVDEFVSRFHGNVDFGSKWREYKKIAKDLTYEEN
ncbi:MULTISPECIES: hypothetical protein [unclassified Candidatus Nanosynbacter]|jgi:hypothetical protein cdiviTM7_01634|uniref:hypothetical protein n=1 Tax=unclassified Candidatus Nanosynbacter TaxID=2725944 RepID=UPI001CB09200|nr:MULTISPECIES: hypothetical protein [unclassified Candidatus Nanosynbacter]MBF1031517.1 hypothetical protein [Candidatus Nanosynbacter sp.]MCJ1963150.1 hypothetical protein [Candidatus Nanosynbacter sp. TM7-033]UOG67640.1 hypothetical protein LRM46_02420 [Candidatus Nanosynbacter sp. HMT-352]